MTVTALPFTRPSLRGFLLALILFVDVVGLAIILLNFGVVLVVFPGAALLALLILALTVLVGGWILIYLRPVRPAALGGAALCAGWGLTAATGTALVANQGLNGVYAKTAGIAFTSNWGAALSAPLNEEWLKVAGVILVALALPGLIRGPMDGFVYGALVGLGFQAAENWTYAVNNVIQSGATAPTLSVLQSTFVRLVLTGLGSHWTMTAVAGAGVGYFLRVRGARGLVLGGCFVALAMLMHFWFNSPIPGNILMVLGKMVVNFLVALTVFLVLRRSTLRRVASYFTEWGVPYRDARAVLTRRGRRRQLRGVPYGEARTLATRAQRDQVVWADTYAPR